MIDTQKLLEEADFVDVLDFLGEESVQKGNRIFIRCPDHLKRIGREDATIGNCVISGNKYRCYACGSYGTVLDYIKSKNNYTFKDAANLLAKINGSMIDRYIITESDSESNNVKDAFPLTTLDIQLLNIHKNIMDDVPDNILYRKEECQDDRKILSKIHYFSFSKEKKKGKNLEMVYETGYTLKKSLIQLYESDTVSFEFMIKGKIRESQAEVVACLDSNVISKFFKNKHFNLKAERELKKNLKELNKLAIRFGLPEVNPK